MKPDAFEQIIKTKPIQLTWKGNRNCFVLHEKAVYNALGNGSVSWKRDDEKKAPYPLPTRFQLIFLPFDPHFIIKDGSVATVDQVAFIHFYFIFSSSVEEYRQTLPDFAEWFSQVRDSNFIIVFDSTKAKENKSRGHIMEKLKSDVQNHANKIFEINASKPAFSGYVLSTFTSALDKYSNNLSSIILTKQGEHDEPSFSLPSLINIEFNYCVFYWSLGLLESAFEVMEEMVKMLNGLLMEASSRVWLPKLRSPLNGCKALILSESLYRNHVNESDSLLSIRSFLLAHQIYASIYVFEERKQKKLEDVATLGNLRNYFITLLARYGLEMVEHVCNDWHRLALTEHRLLQEYVKIFWLEEVLIFLGFIGDFFDSESSARFVTQIHQILIDGWETICYDKHKKNYVEWFDSINKVDESLSPLVHTLRFLRPDELHICYNETLKRGLNVMKKHDWKIYYTQNKWRRVKLLYELGKKDTFRTEAMELIECISRTKLPIPWTFQVLDTLYGQYKGDVEKDPKLLCVLLKSRFIYFPTKENLKALRALKRAELSVLNKFEWEYNTPFPFEIKAVLNDLITSKVGQVFTFAIKVNCLLPIEVECKSTAVLCCLDSDQAMSANPCYKIRKEGNVFKISNVQKALTLAKCSQLFTRTSTQMGNKVIAKLVDGSILKPGFNVLQFEAQCTNAGLYCLNKVNILPTTHDSFSLSYQHEKTLNPHLKPLLCYCGLDRPLVKICNDEQVLFAGVSQKLKLYLEFGSSDVGHIQVSLADGKSQVEFLNKEKKWTKKLAMEVYRDESGPSKVIEIGCCAEIDRMNYSAGGQCKIMHKIRVEWMGNVFFFNISFKSILSIKTMTSILEDRILFEMDVERCDSFTELLILPFAAKIQSANVKQNNTDHPNLLNPSLDPIPASATYRLIWQLPPNRDDTLHMDYTISLAYKITPSGNATTMSEDMVKMISSRDYVFQDTIGFTAPNVEFEVCTRILTERPQTVICRSDHPCDLAVTLRALSDNPQTVIVSIESDPNHWALVERFKVVPMKGNGLGQCSFQIVPKATGFLPYPAVFVHRCNGTQSLTEKDPSMVDTILFGERVTHFNRSEAKQIHVLNGFTSTDDSNSAKSTSSTGTKRSLRSQAKERLKMLFE